MSIRGIISEDGSPMSDVRLQTIGGNWISNDLSTDEDGYSAESGTNSAVASGAIIEI